MADKIYSGIIYEEPSNLFDEQAWNDFRQQMLDEVAAHPDWQEPVDSLQFADEHLVWISNSRLDTRKAA